MTAFAQKGADGLPAVSDEAAYFAPDLSRLAAKIAPQKGDAKARRRWVVQWVLNPNIYHPRTRMPITHLTVQQACDVADWLLSQEVNPKEIRAGRPTRERRGRKRWWRWPASIWPRRPA